MKDKNYGTLRWAERYSEGVALLSKDFAYEDYIFQLDALKDWIFDLQQKYDGALDELTKSGSKVPIRHME